MASSARLERGGQVVYEFEVEAEYPGVGSSTYVALGWSEDAAAGEEAVAVSNTFYSPFTQLYWNQAGGDGELSLVEDPAQDAIGIVSEEVRAAVLYTRGKRAWLQFSPYNDFCTCAHGRASFCLRHSAFSQTAFAKLPW